MNYLIGIDIGTSGTKTVLFDTDGRIAASAGEEYPLYHPATGWAEQDPEEWWRAACHTIRKVIDASGISASEIAAIGVTGQMHGAVLIDRNSKVLRPAILWCDQRTAAECEQITAIIGRNKLFEIAANPAITGFTAPKVQWVKNNEPELFGKIYKVLLPKDYIKYRMTGRFASEPSDASGTLWLDVKRRAWSGDILTELGLSPDQMPEILESHLVCGHVKSEVADLTGLLEGTPVVGGAGDQAAGAIGSGVVSPGVTSCTIGTSGVVFVSLDRPIEDEQGRVHVFCHAIPETWHVMGVTQSAGLSFRWLRDHVCGEEVAAARALGLDPYQLMTGQAEKALPGCRGLIFLPYLMGERTPHLDPKARGAFIGLSAVHGKTDMIRAVMEGVAYSLLDCFHVIRGLGLSVNEVRAAGGGARSRLWRQILADVFCEPVKTVSAEGGTARGAAILAGAGVGVYGSVSDGCAKTIRVGDALRPNPALSGEYQKNYHLFASLYPLLRETFHRLPE